MSLFGELLLNFEVSFLYLSQVLSVAVHNHYKRIYHASLQKGLVFFYNICIKIAILGNISFQFMSMSWLLLLLWICVAGRELNQVPKIG